MTTIEVQVPDSVFRALHASPADVARDNRVAAAVDWFAKGLLSQGRAAEMSGLSRWAFIQELGRRGVPAINIPIEELREELRSLGEE
jgi:predicted HTH domain antitoxin